MIRFGLPMPLGEQIRIGAQRTWRSLTAVLDTAAGDARKAGRWLGSPRYHLRRRAALRWAERHLDELDVQYYRLVDILCWAAKDGDHEGRDQKYAEVRGWFLAHYRHVEPVLAPLASIPEAEDRVDAFRSLFAPESVETTIQSGAAIQQLFHTQSALQELRLMVEKR